jgi:hypothetical protein
MSQFLREVLKCPGASWVIGRRNARRLAGIPGVLVHGRMDISSPLDVPWQLSQAWSSSRLILVAFLAGILRVPAAALELAGKIPQQGPAWYVVLTAIVGMIQFMIALTMAAGYRRSGVWGE